MRIAALLPCLLLTACLATGEQPAPQASAVAAAPAAEPAPAAAKPPPSSPRGGSAAAGGATTSAARAAPSTDPEGRKDPLTQARVDCWMKVEHEKDARDLDRRIAFVDKCVAEAMKRKP